MLFNTCMGSCLSVTIGSCPSIPDILHLTFIESTWKITGQNHLFEFFLIKFGFVYRSEGLFLYL